MPALLTLSALSVLALPARWEGVPLVFAPPAGASWTVELEAELDVSGGELTVVMEGAEVPAMYLPEIAFEMRERHAFTLTEALVEAGGERALLRRYDVLGWENEGSMGMTMADGTGGEDARWPWEEELETPLEGRVVRFPLEGEQEPRAADGGEAELPEQLSLDLGWSALLPAEPLAEGDEWEVGGEAAAALWKPGGELGWIVPEEAASHLDPPFDERDFGGGLVLRLAELDREAGRARIEVAGELTRTTVRPGDLTQVPVVDGTATDTVEEVWEVEGTLVWDLAAGRLASLALQGPWSSETTTERDPGQEGPTYESTFSYAGTYALRVACEPSAEREPLEAASRR